MYYKSAVTANFLSTDLAILTTCVVQRQRVSHQFFEFGLGNLSK